MLRLSKQINRIRQSICLNVICIFSFLSILVSNCKYCDEKTHLYYFCHFVHNLVTRIHYLVICSILILLILIIYIIFIYTLFIIQQHHVCCLHNCFLFESTFVFHFAMYIFIVQLYIHQCSCYSYSISSLSFIVSHLIFHIQSL